MPLYVVTGGAGFIGSHLTDALLAAGHHVRVLDDLSTGKRENLPAGCTLVEADICDRPALADALNGASGCFHLAAIASVARANEDWAGTHRVNQTGSVTVLDSCRKPGGIGLPVVYASSAAVYGDIGDRVASEALPCTPQTAYGVDKYGSELHAAVGWGVHRVPSFGLRFFNVYGPRQDPASPYSGVISIFADRIAKGLPVTLHGDGGQSRDFVYVADVVAHLMAAMAYSQERPAANVVNVCTGRETSISALALTIGSLCGRAADTSFGPARAGDIRRSLGDVSLAIRLLQVSASTLLQDGLQQTL